MKYETVQWGGKPVQTLDEASRILLAQAVFGAAMYMKEGAQWAADKLAGLKLPPAQHAAKLREGVSVYYNLSIKGRNKWDGHNTEQLPVETQRHIRNARAGAAEASVLARLLKT